MPSASPWMAPERYLALPVQWGRDQIREVNPHRFAMELLTGVLWCSAEEQLAVGFKDVTCREFWAAGHFPGFPVMPGVLIVEAAAQLCGFYYRKIIGGSHYFALGALEEVKFREPVRPGSRLYLAIKPRILREHRGTFLFQGYLADRIVLEGRLLGVTVRP